MVPLRSNPASRWWTGSAAVLFALSPIFAQAAEASRLDQAWALLLRGKYAAARDQFEPLSADDPRAAVGLARTFWAQGKDDEAIKALRAAGDNAEAQAELARAFFERGRYDEAEQCVEAALRLNPDQLLAGWIRGELHRVRGRLKEAETAYRRLIAYYNEHDVRDAESLRWIGLAAGQYARWNRQSDQFKFLVQDLYPRAIEIDEAYWPALYEAGLLYLEKYNQRDAAVALSKALAINPLAAEVHAAVARLALLDRDIERAQRSVERALEINPRFLPAWLAKAELAWENFDPAGALRILQDSALPLNPESEESLGRIAACYALEDGLPEKGDGSRLDELMREAEGRNAHGGEFYFAMAAWLNARHKLPEAQWCYEEAIRRMPQLLGPQSELGLMMMAAAEEERARPLLERALADDPFHVRVFNSLEVLDLLGEMETLETEHGRIKYDRQADGLLARYAARYVDQAMPELCELFGYRPPQKALVEFFNRSKGHSGHEWFGTRMVGLPYVGPVAASTGKMLAMVSPTDPGLGMRFNWAQVLRHELVHVITLQQTAFNCPHWYTEGLAVWCENRPRPQKWTELLLRRVPAGELLTLETINFGFTRPQSSEDWQMAYCQAELYVEFMLEGRSPAVLRDLLAAYAEGLDTPEAIQRVFHVEAAEFEQDFRAYLQRLVSGFRSFDEPAAETFAELISAQRKAPGDPDLAARTAFGYLRRGAKDEARTLANRAIELEPRHQLATYVLARLAAESQNRAEAIRLLESALDRSAPDARLLGLLASLKLEQKEYATAAEFYELGGQNAPHDLRWWRSLALVYSRSKDAEKLVPVLRRLAEAEEDNLEVRLELARRALAEQDHRAAADWANQAIQIDVQSVEAHCLIAEALAGDDNLSQAVEEYQAAIELDPDRPESRQALAALQVRMGRPADARQTLEELLRRHPDDRNALRTLEDLQEKTEP